MDNERFDQLSRGLAKAKTRRQVLRSLFVGAVASASGVAPRAAEAAAPNPNPNKCVQEGGTCKSDKKCCLGACCNGKCCSYQCLGGTTCCGPDSVKFVCGISCCPRDTYNECCNGICVNTNVDSKNCGGCGKACPPGSICDGGGKCVCEPPLLLCNGVCINPLTDSAHCGGCPPASGEACFGGATCQNGFCKCPPGEDFCLVNGQGKCIPILADKNNCGTCEHVCGTGAQNEYWICQAGECVCDPNAPCGPGESTDPTTCQCTCSPEPCPPGGFVRDPVSCLCVCPANYTFGTDPHTGQQMCCPNHCLQPGGLCCFSSQVCVGSAGSATCCSTDANGNPVC
jgi:hypothetical protein